MPDRLNFATAPRAGDSVQLPSYDIKNHGIGMVHLGLGAFHRAHQAVYTDSALAAVGGDWRIKGVSLRSDSVSKLLNPQDGLYTLITRGPDGAHNQVIGSIEGVLSPADGVGAVLNAISHPGVKIVSLTVTEKAYGFDAGLAGLDMNHPDIAHDLANPDHPRGVIAIVVAGLRQRKIEGARAFTVLCCDNLPNNGELLQKAVLEFAQALDDSLARWIEENATFPSTMVDRITPAATEQTRRDAFAATGLDDPAAVETEPFTQWVVEDDFVDGRPAWEAGGALFVDSVAPYENMKLRMLNGAHSMLAYAGYLSGHDYVRDVMGDENLAKLVERHMCAAASTLLPVSELDYQNYKDQLLQRFRNPAIAHETYQIAMDGTQKLPQRIFAPALDALEADQDLQPFAFATAAWMRYCLGETDAGEKYALRDPREVEITRALKGTRDAEKIVEQLHGLGDFVPQRLRQDNEWCRMTISILGSFVNKGAVSTIVDQF